MWWHAAIEHIKHSIFFDDYFVHSLNFSYCFNQNWTCVNKNAFIVLVVTPFPKEWSETQSHKSTLKKKKLSMRKIEITSKTMPTDWWKPTFSRVCSIQVIVCFFEHFHERIGRNFEEPEKNKGIFLHRQRFLGGRRKNDISRNENALLHRHGECAKEITGA